MDEQYRLKKYTAAEMEALLDKIAEGTGYTKSEIDEMLVEKVDAEEGKGLSTNDFTDSDKVQISANKAGIGAVANVGAKNKLASTLDLAYLKSINRSGTWEDNVYTLNSISFTVNADGTVLANGTPSAQTVFLLITKARLAEDIAAGNYTLSGCPSGGGESGSNYRIFAYNPSSTVNGATDIGNGVEVHCDYSHSKDANIAIVIGANKTVDALLFSPMLRDAAIEDSTYVPYAPSNRELYETQNRITSETLSYRYDVISTWTWTAVYQSNNLKYYTNISLTGWDEIYSVGIANSTHIGPWMIYIESFRANRIQIGLIDLTGTGTAPNITDTQIGIDVCIYGKKST